MHTQSITHRHRPSARAWDIVIGAQWAGASPGFAGTRRTEASVITDLCACGAERHVWLGRPDQTARTHWIGGGVSDYEEED